MKEKTKEGTRSPLEKFAWVCLEKAGLKFEYEKTFELLPPFSFDGVVIEKTPKKKILHNKSENHRNIKFTPDFIGPSWVMEVKGLRRPDFDLRWKLFKDLIRDEHWILFLPTTRLEVMVCVNIIKKWVDGDQYWPDERILQEYSDVKQFAEKYTKPKTFPAEKRKTGPVRKRGLNSPKSRQRRRLPSN